MTPAARGAMFHPVSPRAGDPCAPAGDAGRPRSAPGWRKGRRRGLKIPGASARVGSTPTPGMVRHKDLRESARWVCEARQVGIVPELCRNTRDRLRGLAFGFLIVRLTRKGRMLRDRTAAHVEEGKNKPYSLGRTQADGEDRSLTLGADAAGAVEALIPQAAGRHSSTRCQRSPVKKLSTSAFDRTDGRARPWQRRKESIRAGRGPMCCTSLYRA